MLKIIWDSSAPKVRQPIPKYINCFIGATYMFNVHLCRAGFTNMRVN